MSEANLWTVLRKRMIPDHWSEVTRHEDAYQKGIADVSFVQFMRDHSLSGKLETGRHGWMELKWRACWPKRPTTAVTLPHYTDEQRRWLWQKGEAGGMTFLFAQIANSYMLFDHKQAQRVGLITADELIEAACWMATKLNGESLARAIMEVG